MSAPAVESQACAEAAAELVRSLEDQKAALMTEMEEAAAAAADQLQVQQKAAEDADRVCRQEHDTAVLKLNAAISDGQVSIIIVQLVSGH